MLSFILDCLLQRQNGVDRVLILISQVKVNSKKTDTGPGISKV